MVSLGAGQVNDQTANFGLDFTQPNYFQTQNFFMIQIHKQQNNLEMQIISSSNL